MTREILKGETSFTMSGEDMTGETGLRREVAGGLEVEASVGEEVEAGPCTEETSVETVATRQREGEAGDTRCHHHRRE